MKFVVDIITPQGFNDRMRGIERIIPVAQFRDLNRSEANRLASRLLGAKEIEGSSEMPTGQRFLAPGLCAVISRQE